MWQKIADERQMSATGLLKTWIYAKLIMFGFLNVVQAIIMGIGSDIRL
jgi:hypothetical protein